MTHGQRTTAHPCLQCKGFQCSHICDISEAYMLLYKNRFTDTLTTPDAAHRSKQPTREPLHLSFIRTTPSGGRPSSSSTHLYPMCSVSSTARSAGYTSPRASASSSAPSARLAQEARLLRCPPAQSTQSRRSDRRSRRVWRVGACNRPATPSGKTTRSSVVRRQPRLSERRRVRMPMSTGPG